ncbi:MAG TPA: helix-turn-helix domain-containing protein [Pseudonocardiaceae bacterium]
MAAEVRAEMARQNVPQRELGRVLGLSQGAAWRRLKGEVPFDVSELSKVADLLGVPMTQFLPAATESVAGVA